MITLHYIDIIYEYIYGLFQAVVIRINGPIPVPLIRENPAAFLKYPEQTLLEMNIPTRVREE